MNLNSSIKTSILPSTSMNHMGYWFIHNSLVNIESLLLKEMNGKSINLKKQLNLDGFSYETYSYLKKVMNYYSYSQN